MNKYYSPALPHQNTIKWWPLNTSHRSSTSTTISLPLQDQNIQQLGVCLSHHSHFLQLFNCHSYRKLVYYKCRPKMLINSNHSHGYFCKLFISCLYRFFRNSMTCMYTYAEPDSREIMSWLEFLLAICFGAVTISLAQDQASPRCSLEERERTECGRRRRQMQCI